MSQPPKADIQSDLSGASTGSAQLCAAWTAGSGANSAQSVLVGGTALVGPGDVLKCSFFTS